MCEKNVLCVCCRSSWDPYKNTHSNNTNQRHYTAASIITTGSINLSLNHRNYIALYAIVCTDVYAGKKNMLLLQSLALEVIVALSQP